jgi:hypothetical protein
MIFGLAAYAQLPFEPLPQALIGVALVLGVAVAMAWRFRALPVVALLGAFWAGFCLLPIHSALFGTQMLAFPAYGEFEARVDEIISANAEERRIVVSNLVPMERRGRWQSPKRGCWCLPSRRWNWATPYPAGSGWRPYRGRFCPAAMTGSFIRISPALAPMAR